MVIFGIDPGYAIVGWGAIGFKSNTYKALGFGAVETQAGMDFNYRLEYIYDEIFNVLNRCRPDALAIEKLYFQNNQKTAIMVAEARRSYSACRTKTENTDLRIHAVAGKNCRYRLRQGKKAAGYGNDTQTFTFVGSAETR